MAQKIEISGVSFYLVPENEFEKYLTFIGQNTPNNLSQKEENLLDINYILDLIKPIEPKITNNRPQEINPIQVARSNQVPQAVGKPNSYRYRFVAGNLLPRDVIGVNTTNLNILGRGEKKWSEANGQVEFTDSIGF